MKPYFSCTISGRPYVKKNNQRAFGSGRFKRIVYTPQYQSWERNAVLSVKQALALLKNFRTIDHTVNLRALFYFQNRQAEPDLSALYEGIQDVLEKCEVIENDKMIGGHDGSRKLFGHEPRIELQLLKLQG